MKDMKHKRFLFQLVPQTPHTEGIEFGLLPTPTTQEPTRECNSTENGRRITNNGADSYSLNIGRMESMGLLPTPTTGADQGTQYNQGGRSLKNYMNHHQMLPTPMAQNRETTLEKTLDRKERYGGEKRTMYLENYAVMGMLPTPRVKGHGNSHQRIEEGKIDDLTTMAKRGMLPTPTVNDMKNATLPHSQLERQDSIVKRILQTTQTGKTSQLNPLFVAEMMGFPPNWTVLPLQNGETNQLKAMEMP